MQTAQPRTWQRVCGFAVPAVSQAIEGGSSRPLQPESRGSPQALVGHAPACANRLRSPAAVPESAARIGSPSWRRSWPKCKRPVIPSPHVQLVHIAPLPAGAAGERGAQISAHGQELALELVKQKSKSRCKRTSPPDKNMLRSYQSDRSN